MRKNYRAPRIYRYASFIPSQQAAKSASLPSNNPEYIGMLLSFQHSACFEFGIDWIYILAHAEYR